jgi:hypothetical protein
MPAYRSRTTTHGRNMAGARGLWRATGVKDSDFGKPIIAIVNSFTQFVPGHVHLKDLGQMVAREVEAAGGVAKEFNTIAVDDGIAMGHDGMLYSLPSREMIADSVEYMVNAHCADAMVCISNCDKITPGMLMAAMRLNIPAVFVSGGPMEAGKAIIKGRELALDLVDAMVSAADDKYTDEEVGRDREGRLPDLRVVQRHVHRQFDELPDRGAGPVAARQWLAPWPPTPTASGCSSRPGTWPSIWPAATMNRTTPHPAAQRGQQGRLRKRDGAGYRHGRVDQHRAAHPGRRAGGRHRLSPWMTSTAVAQGALPVQGRARQAGRAYGRRAPRRRHHGDPGPAGQCGPDLQPRLPTVHAPTMGAALDHWDISRTNHESVRKLFMAAPRAVCRRTAFSQSLANGRAGS